jgi:hypothetical protein
LLSIQQNKTRKLRKTSLNLLDEWHQENLNPGRRGGKPATNRLSYGAASLEALSCVPFIKGPSSFPETKEVLRKDAIFGLPVHIFSCSGIYLFLSRDFLIASSKKSLLVSRAAACLAKYTDPTRSLDICHISEV